MRTGLRIPLFKAGAVLAVVAGVHVAEFSANTLSAHAASPARPVQLAQADTEATAEDQSWIGIEFVDVSRTVARANGLDHPAGIHVLSVTAHSGAGKAGVRAGDIILAIGGQPALDGREFGKLLDAVWPGRTLPFVILRSGARVELDVTLGGLISGNRQEAEAGNPEAMHLMGIAHAFGRGTKRDVREAVRWLSRAAKLGYADAQYDLALLYEAGDGIAKDDARAVRWLTKAALQNHGRAETLLARRYHQGRGVERNTRRAMQWYRRAARDGDSVGAVDLGVAYLRGKIVPKDNAKAVEYFHLAADKGNPNAINNLGVMYWHGLGVKKDREEAARWWRLAALKGITDASKSMKKFNIEPYDAAEIQQLLSELGFDPGPADGKPGAKTRAAIRAFEKQREMTVTGGPSLEIYAALKIAAQDLRRERLIARYDIRPAPAPAVKPVDEEDILKGLD